MIQPRRPERTGVSPLDPRRACEQSVTWVTTVTVRDGDGLRWMTANSCILVSLDPPPVPVSIDLRSRTHHPVSDQGRFAVNVLSRRHHAWSDRFAGRHGEHSHTFEDVPHCLIDGLPMLEDASAAFACRVTPVHPTWDHSLFIGEVEHLEWRPDGEPLPFFGGRNRRLSPRMLRSRSGKESLARQIFPPQQVGDVGRTGPRSPLGGDVAAK